MHATRLLPVILSAILPLCAFAQGSPAPSASAARTMAQSSAPDAAELTTLLNDFLAGASRNDVARHDRFWAEDLIYTGSSGKRIGKADIMRDVRKEAAAPQESDEKSTFSAEEIRIQQYGTTAIVAFRLVGVTSKGGKTETANYLNTGTFLKRDGKWQAVSWQATKMPAENEPKK
jgi:ketosteroid isomerase-like protein